jgi:hypothetical protein
VKQGCPVSPLLFNLRVEVLLQGVQKETERRGAFIEMGEERIIFATQAGADDVVFYS